MPYHQNILWIIFLPYALLINNNCVTYYHWGGQSSDECIFKYFETFSGNCYKCTFRDITQLDEITLENSNSFILILSGFISTLTSKVISNPNYVRILQINNVQLDKIETNALEDYNKLKQLDLKHNKLTNIENYIFDHLTNLNVLLLSNNSISTLGQHSFADLNSLKKLDLSKNKLKFISIIIFHSTPILEVLDISYNFMESIDVVELKHLTQLNEINIGGNTGYIKLNCTALSKELKFYKTLAIAVKGEAKNESNILGIPCFDSNFTLSATENILIQDPKETKIQDSFEQKTSLNKLINVTTSNQETIYTYVKTNIAILTILLICIGFVLILASYKMFIRNQFWYKSYWTRKTASNINEESGL